MKKIYQKLIDQKLLKEEKVNFAHIGKVLGRAQNNLKSARILFNNSQEEGAYEMAYEGMLLAGRALVFSFGARPRAQGSHKIVIEFAGMVLGNNFDILIKKFDRMRKTRHYLIYGAGFPISKTEAESAIKTADEFIEKINKIIKNKNPQRKLF